MNRNHSTVVRVSAAKVAIVTTTLAVVEDLTKIWGSAALGLHLTNAHFTTRPLSTEDLAERCSVSTETIRRWLKPLINVDRVHMTRRGRNVTYKAREEWANRTAEQLIHCVDQFVARRHDVVEIDTGLAFGRVRQ